MRHVLQTINELETFKQSLRVRYHPMFSSDTGTDLEQLILQELVIGWEKAERALVNTFPLHWHLYALSVTSLESRWIQRRRSPGMWHHLYLAGVFTLLCI